jgi:hypothetical protein
MTAETSSLEVTWIPKEPRCAYKDLSRHPKGCRTQDMRGKLSNNVYLVGLNQRKREKKDKQSKKQRNDVKPRWSIMAYEPRDEST